MKLTCMIVLLAIFQSFAGASFSQTASLSLKLNNSSVRNVLLTIEDQTEYYFLYSSKMIDTNRKVSIDMQGAKIGDILEKLFKGTNVSYTIEGRQIVLSSDDEVVGSFSSQQQRTVTGVVTDASGQPLPGASVVVKGTTAGTVTDVDGRFSLPVPAGSQTLVFSFVGMKTIEQAIAGRTKVDVKLEEETVGIDEVVAIAYGTAKRKDLTGSISTVDASLIATQANSTVTRALEGAVPGIQVSAIDGQPGLDMGIRVRGMGSSSQNNSNALVVIDGVPAQHDNPLSTINPKDIASVTVLKDAASTALYGSRAANGVLLITTKKGSKGETKISFEGRWGVNQVGPYQYDKMSDPKDIYEYTWLAIYNSVRFGVSGGLSANYSTNVQNPNMSHEAAAEFASAHLFNYTGSTTKFTRNALGNWMLYDVPGAAYTPDGTSATSSATMSGAYLVNPDGKLNPNARFLYDDDYDKYLLKNNFRQEYNVSASGGSDKMDYFFSLGYLEDPSYILGSEFARYNGRTNLNAQLYDWLKLGTNISYSWRETQMPATRYGRNPGSATANIFRYINGQNQLIQLYARDENGDYIYENGEKKVHVQAGDTYSPLGNTSTSLSSTNVLDMLDMDKDLRKSSDIITRSYADIQLAKDLKLTTNLGFEKYHETRTRYWNSETGQAAGTGAFGKVYQNVTILNTQQLLNYNRDFGKHHLEALAGHEFNKYHFETMYYNSAYELIPGFATFVNFVGHYTGGTFSSPGGNEYETAMESYLTRFNYVFDEKYYAELSARRDGSSKFKYNKDRWGNFWSAGAGWRISSEGFMSNTKNWLDNLKVRASYGLIGNQSGVGTYSGYQTWSYGATYTSTTGGNGIPASFTLNPGAYVIDNLTWEKTKTFDAGLDFGFFNRVHGTFDVYNKLTFDAFFAEPIAYSLGQSTITRNSGEIRNRGFEIELNVDLIKNKDLFWTVSLNGTHYYTKLADFPDNIASKVLDGNYTATTDAWSAAGGGTSSGITYLRGEGKDFYNLYLFKYAGVDQSTGLPLFYHKVTDGDSNFPDAEVGSDVKTTNYSLASRYEVGDAIPDWIGGFSTTVRYKNFDFTGMLAYQIGGKFYSTEYGNNLYRSGNIGGPKSAELIGNTWTPENTDAKFPMAIYGESYTDGSTFGSWLYTDMALFDATYLNLKNITLGYTVPKKVLQRYRINNMRLYFSADNLLMVTSHSGIDPRMSLVGGFEVGAYTYPSMRTISFGVNLDL